MYNDYFGLSQAPFKITPDTRLFYNGGRRGDILDALVDGIASGEGIMKVVGEVGTGKTMLCRMLETRLPSKFEIVYLANPNLTPEDILHAIVLEMELPVDASADRLQIMQALQHYLLEKHAEGRQVVMFVEEAQSMPLETLDEIRLLSDLETQREKLLQIVLFGQPELDEKLEQPSIRQLRERITHSSNLAPLASDEIKEYMIFRLRAVGCRGPDVFRSNAYGYICRASQGLTRRVNILADKALLAAFTDDTRDVSRRHVKLAINDCQYDVRRLRSLPELSMAAGIVLMVAALGWGFLSPAGLSGAQLLAVLPVQSTPQPDAAPAAAGTSEPASNAAVRLVTPAGEHQPTLTDPEPPVSRAQVAEAETERQPAEEGQARATNETSPQSEFAAVALESQFVRLESETENAEPGVETEVVAASVVHAPPSWDGVAAEEANQTAPVDTAVAEPDAEVVAGAEQQTPAPPRAVTVAAEAHSASSLTLLGRLTFSLGLRERPPELASPAAQTAVEPVSEPPVDAGPEQRVLATMRASGNETNPLLNARLQATRDWLQVASANQFSIQLLATPWYEHAVLEVFLRRRHRAGELQSVYVYESMIKNKVWYRVLYGQFPGRSNARQTLNDLPPELQRYRPFIRKLSDFEIVS